MKKILLTILLPALLLAQTKPRNPVAPSGSWATDLVRAFAFSPADSVRIDSVKDWSPYDSWPICSQFTAGSWTTDSEGPKYEFSGGNSSGTSLIEDMQLIRVPSDTGGYSAFSDKITIVARLEVSASGSVNGIYSHTNIALTPRYSVKANEIDLDNNNVPHWFINNATEKSVSWNVGGPGSFKTTLILTYAGDSLRVYQDGSFKGATNQTGNVQDWGELYVPYISLVDIGGSFPYAAWNGRMYMCCIWKRVLTSSERTQIWNDPYVMFRTAAAATSRRRWIVQSMFPENFIFVVTTISILGIFIGICDMIRRERMMRREN